MQKVSKQSLAMIALSILLAISIALTFTFAALTATRTATGTITLSGTVSVEWSYTGNDYVKIDDGKGASINLTDGDFDFNLRDNKTVATLKSTVYAELSKLSVKITNGASSSLVWAIKTAADTEGKITLTPADDYNSRYSTGTLDGVNEKEEKIGFDKIIKSISIGDVDNFGSSGVNFTITAEIMPANKQ